MSWNWKHLKGESWLVHTKRSSKLSILMLLSGFAMMVHMIVPFWQQPKWLQGASIRDVLDESLRS